MAVVPRWEWRTFGDDFGTAERRLRETGSERVEESEELYLLAAGSDNSAKVRGGTIDVKERLAVDSGGLEQWRPVIKEPFPLTSVTVRRVMPYLRVDIPLDLETYTPDELSASLDGNDDVRVVRVRKRRARYTVGGCMAEVTELGLERTATRTLAIEAEDPERVRATVLGLGLDGRPLACMARGLKAEVGLDRPRYAAIDVGTNSVKFYVGQWEEDGRWRTIVDRAEVTRLGEGLSDAGQLGSEPVERTAAAIASMAAEARACGADQVAAVGTAGLRIAHNAAELIDAVRARCGVEVEVISGEEEARLAYVAVVAALPELTEAALVVFETGGGSSQFTFGHGARVDERFSLDVGAARVTEQFALDAAVSTEVIEEARAAIAAELGPLQGRPAPDLLVGMGGAVTNMAAVRHQLEDYDPTVVQGTVLERDEVDRQIDLYRSRDASERRSITGLQPGRAAVILAGACIVVSVLELLGRDALTVSDRGLRHGLLAERFGSPVSS